MTPSELRPTLTAFRDMVRARGPRECLEVAVLNKELIPMCFPNRYDPKKLGELYWDNRFRQRLPRFAARAALRWWRWANRQDRWVAVREFDWECEGVNVWTSG